MSSLFKLIHRSIDLLRLLMAGIFPLKIRFSIDLTPQVSYHQYTNDAAPGFWCQNDRAQNGGDEQRVQP